MTELETEQRANKLKIIALLANQMVDMKYNEFKNFAIDESKGIPYLDATIEILEKQVANAKLGLAKLLTFDKLEADRKNLTPEELKQLEADQKRNDAIVDSYLATIDPRASLKGRLYAPNSLILRYRGKVGSDFAKNYPFGVLM